MNIKKAFGSQISMILILIITIVGAIFFLIIQNQVINLEEETLKREKELKQYVERTLFDLRTTLNSRLDNEAKSRESLLIIKNLRETLDKEYIYLRIEAQDKVNEIRGSIDLVEEKIIEEDFEGASNIVEEIIEDLQSSETLSDSDESNEGGVGNNDNPNPNFTFDPDVSGEEGSQNDQENNGDGSDNSNNPNQDGGQNPDDLNGDDENNQDQTGDDNGPNYGPGIKPKVDRNKNDRPDTETELIELQVGD